MPELLSRDALDRLSVMAQAAAPHTVFGIEQPDGDHHVAVLYVTPIGLGCYRIPSAQSIAATTVLPADWHGTLLGATHVVSMPLPGFDAGAYFWIGLPDATP